MAELTAEGYRRKRLSEYRAQLEAGYKAIFGDNIDLTNDSPDGQVIGIAAEEYSDLDQALEYVYNAFDPQASGDVSLSKLVLLNGINRKEATNSTSDVDLTGIAGVIVPEGSIIKTSDTDEQFTLDADVTLTGGSGSGTVTAVNTGAISAIADTLTVIATPISGWSTVTNPTDATEGQDEETDEELRLRRSLSTASSARSVVDAIFGALSELDNVTGVAVLENTSATDVDSTQTLDFPDDFITGNTIDLDVNGVAITQVDFDTEGNHANTVAALAANILASADVATVNAADTSPGSDYEIIGVSGKTIVIDNVIVASGASQSDHTVVTDSASILAHGINAIVDGGDDTEIAETIFNTKSAGCQTTGEESEVVVDDQGGNNTVLFSRPTEVDIDIEVDVLTDPDEFPSDGDQQIKDALVEYGAENLNIGVDVIRSRLYTPVNSIGGHSVTSLTISKSGEALAENDIIMAVNEIAKIIDGNITVNVT